MWKLPLLFLCFSQISQISSQNETGIELTFKLLAQGEQNIKLTNKTDVVLVFGGSGSGKSTFIQWMTGNTNLLSKETFPASGEYLIEDKNDRIGSSKFSKTLFPELVVDEITGIAYYDFAGFKDTRSPSHDIAASFFMKSVLDHVKNVKMLFLTSYFTVQEGMDRSGFPGLLKNINNLIGDIDKFNNSFALVVSKVDNTYVQQGNTLVLKPDSTVIAGIADYLRKVRKDFEEDLKNPDISDKKWKFSRNAIKIVDILLTEEKGEYPRIKLLRKPNKEGPLNENELLAKGKVMMQQMISENLRFTHTDPSDFGFTISDNSKLQINDWVAEINDQVTAIIGGIVNAIKKHLESFVEPMRVEIDANDLDALNQTAPLEFLTQGQKILTDAVDYFSHLSGLNGMGERLATYLSKLGVDVPESMVKDLSKLSKYFEFFQLFREDPLQVSSMAWKSSFQSLLTYLTGSKQALFCRVATL